jgi:hypothetical protein
LFENAHVRSFTGIVVVDIRQPDASIDGIAFGMEHQWRAAVA